MHAGRLSLERVERHGSYDIRVIIIMRKGASKEQIDHVVDRLRERGYGANLSGSEVSVIGAIGVLDDDKARLAEQL